MSEDKIIPTIPADWREPAWIRLPKYTRRELAWLAASLDHSNHLLRQQLVHLKEQLRKETGQ